MSVEPGDADEVTLDDLFQDGRSAEADALLAEGISALGSWLAACLSRRLPVT